MEYKFSELSHVAQEFAYASYYNALNDDLNRDSIVSFEEYGVEAEWDGLLFDAYGNAK